VKRIVVAAIVSIVALASALAAERPLSGTDIRTLLAGNTAVGSSNKGDWRQFFNANGDTLYVRGKEPPSSGAWRVKGDQFCSQWPPATDWTCYTMTGDPALPEPAVTWQGQSGTPFPATIQKGNRL
jgi:hypothetical protein